MRTTPTSPITFTPGQKATSRESLGHSWLGEGTSRLLGRALPFMVLAMLADLSAVVPSGPTALRPFVIGTVLLLVVFLTNLLPWHRLPSWTAVLPSCLYVASAALIITSVGSTQTGLLLILLVPILWTSLYQRRWQSLVVITCTVAGLLGISMAEHVTMPDLAGRVVFWGACSVVIAFTIHGLRSRLGHTVSEREELLRQADSLSRAAGRLTSLLQPAAVVAEACRLAVVMMSPPGTPAKRSQYYRVNRRTASGEWELDSSGNRSRAPFPLAEHPYLTEVLRTGQPTCGAYDLEAVGPTLRSILVKNGTTYGAWFPIAPKGVLHGVLAISSQGAVISDDLFQRAISLANIVELALSSALTLERSEREAATDPLTGLANRRGFEVEVARMRERRPFAVLAVDVDRLKLVNDTFGHAAGDALLVGIAEAASGVMRRGDLIARIGGDEFAAFVGEATEEGACKAAERILSALRSTRVQGVTPTVSIGVACGSPTSELADVLSEADSAMYSAKRRGGRSFVFAAPLIPSVPQR